MGSPSLGPCPLSALIAAAALPAAAAAACCSATNKEAAGAFTALHAAAVAGDEAAYASATKQLEKAIITIFAQVGAGLGWAGLGWAGLAKTAHGTAAGCPARQRCRLVVS